MKKTLALLLAVLMLVSVLSACGTTAETPAAPTAEATAETMGTETPEEESALEAQDLIFATMDVGTSIYTYSSAIANILLEYLPEGSTIDVPTTSPGGLGAAYLLAQGKSDLIIVNDVGFISYKVFKWVDKRYPHTRRIPIAGLAYCFILSYVAERYFGIADITGAYVAGIILCSINDSEYIESKIDINSYMLFGPIFFASIGLKTNIDNITGSILLFSLGFVVVGLIGKIIGCGLIAKACKFNFPDSLKIGVGMMTRGEVALIVAQKGLSAGLLEPVYFTSVILLIIVSSIATPIVLKYLYSKDKEPEKVQA